MRAQHYCYPIIFGCRGKADKCSVIVKNKGLSGYSFLICRLMHAVDYGTVIEKENIGHGICHLHFCNLEAANAFRDSAIKLVQMMEEEHPGADDGGNEGRR